MKNIFKKMHFVTYVTKAMPRILALKGEINGTTKQSEKTLRFGSGCFFITRTEAVNSELNIKQPWQADCAAAATNAGCWQGANPNAD